MTKPHSTDTSPIFLQIEVEYYLTAGLVSVEERIVDDRLVSIYGENYKTIEDILSQSPLWIWRNPNNPSEIRVIDGLHRLFSAYDVGMNSVPCRVTECSKEEFLKLRRLQTMAHSNVASYRCINWLMKAYEEVGYELPIPSVLKLLENKSMIPGKNLAGKFNITLGRVQETMNFVREWISEYGLLPQNAYDILELINLLGQDNIDILGKDGIVRDHVKQAYGDLKALPDYERAAVANHILRLTAGTYKPKSTIQILTRAYRLGNENHRTALLKSTTYPEAEKVYDDVRIYIAKNGASHHDGIKKEKKRGYLQALSHKLLRPEVKNAPPGIEIYNFHDEGNKVLIMFSGGIYVKGFNERTGGLSFYKVDGMYMLGFDTEENNLEQSNVFTTKDTTYTIIKSPSEVPSYIGGLTDYLKERSKARKKTAQIITYSLLRRPYDERLALLFREDYSYSGEYGNWIVGTPFPVLDTLGSKEGLDRFINRFGGTIEPTQDGLVHIVTNPVLFTRILNESVPY